MLHGTAHRPLAVALTCVTVAGLSACETAESSDAPTDGTVVTTIPTVPAGTSLTFTFDEAVSTSSHHRGDRVMATLASDVAGLEGGVVLASGTKARWVVSEATKGDEGALLAIRLEAVSVDGQWYPVRGTITDAGDGTDAEAIPATTGEEQPADARASGEPRIAFGPDARALVETARGGTSGATAEATLAEPMAMPAEATTPPTDPMAARDTTRPVLEQDAGPIFAVVSREGAVELPAGSRVIVRITDRLVVSDEY